MLLEAGRHAGGMTSGGLGHTDLGDPRVVGGMPARFRCTTRRTSCGSCPTTPRSPPTQRAWRWVHEFGGPLGMVVTEGYLSVPVPAYAIPLRSLVPRYADCTNLLVPVCVSASHVAFASLRMEVQYTMLGHAAGLAAAMAARTGRAVQAVDVAALQDRLHDDGQVLAVTRAR